MSDRKNHRRDARRSVQKLNRAGIKPATTVATYGACGVCFDYLLLSDGVCLACTVGKANLPFGIREER